MKIDLFQRAVLLGLAYLLEGGNQSLKSRKERALAYVLETAALDGAMPDNISRAVAERMRTSR